VSNETFGLVPARRFGDFQPDSIAFSVTVLNMTIIKLPAGSVTFARVTGPDRGEYSSTHIATVGIDCEPVLQRDLADDAAK